MSQNDNGITRVAVISDTHGGHRLGLLAPDIKLETLSGEPSEAWTPEQSETNRVNWNLQNLLIEQTADTPGDICLIHVGDPFWGAKHPSGAIDLSEGVQIQIALADLAPWFDVPTLRRVLMVSGTDAHEYEANSALITLLKMLRLTYPDVEIVGAHHALVDAGGLLIDVAHHGPPPGSRSWLQGNVALFHLRDMVMRHLLAGKCPPDLFLYGHYHTKVVVTLTLGDREYRLIIMPSFMGGLTGYSRMRTRSEYEITTGGCYFDIKDESIGKIKWVTKTLDLRTRLSWIH